MAKDPREYGYEGDMAISQLKSIVANAEKLMSMLKPESDLPEWAQLKITLAQDYVLTARDYMESELKEAVSPAQQAAIAIAMKKAGKKPKDQKDEACWSGYTAIGMKMKNGKEVPNCVPSSEAVTTDKPPFAGPFKKIDPAKQPARSRLKTLTKKARETIAKSSTKKSKQPVIYIMPSSNNEKRKENANAIMGFW